MTVKLWINSRLKEILATVPRTERIEMAESHANVFIFRAILPLLCLMLGYLKSRPRVAHLPNGDTTAALIELRQSQSKIFLHTPQWRVFKSPHRGVVGVSLVFDDVIFHQLHFSPFRKAVTIAAMSNDALRFMKDWPAIEGFQPGCPEHINSPRF